MALKSESSTTNTDNQTSPVEQLHYKRRNLRSLRHRKQVQKRICSSIITEEEDNHPIAEVEVGGILFKGLLDSGANISIFGRDCQEFLDSTGIKLKSLSSHTLTASGDLMRKICYIEVVVNFKHKSRLMYLYLVPLLQQKLYLGVDFRSIFGIKPVTVNKLQVPDTKEIKKTTSSEHNVHTLTEVQRRKLAEVIEMFPNCDKVGLGRTSLVTHSIDTRDTKPVKQRLYILSLAKQLEAYS